MPTTQDNLGVLVAWLDAMRRADLDALSQLYAPDVVWRGVPADAICRNRREVLHMLAARLDEGFEATEALELTAGENTVVLGVRSPALQQIGDEPLHGQLFNVFTLAGGRIAAVHDFTTREEALGVAGITAPRWA
jgi:ketosteroid isomerase-like protein